MITIQEALTLTKEELKRFLKAISTESRQYCWYIHRGDGLPCLVAHIDTFHDTKWNVYKRLLTDGDFFMSPSGLGADDRAGVFALLHLYEQGIDANFLFTDLEESGGIGAMEACEKLEEYLSKVPYFIEIDRRGCLEAVFYNDEEFLVPEFVEAVEDTDFSIGLGSFSDISIIGETFQVASVNLSAGFWNEHTTSEFFSLSWLNETIKRVPILIEKLGHKRYSLPERKYFSYPRTRYWNGKGKGWKGKHDPYYYLSDELAELILMEEDTGWDWIDYDDFYYYHFTSANTKRKKSKK